MPSDITGAKRPPYQVVLKGVLSIGIATAIVFMIAGMIGDGVYTQFHNAIKEASSSAASNSQLVSAFGWDDLGKEEIANNIVALYDEALKLFPSTILLLGAVVSYVEYIILSRALSKRGEVMLMPKFREFNLPKNAVMGLVAMYVAIWLLSVTGVMTDTAYYLNINAVFDMAFCLQGISVVFMLFYMKRIPKVFSVIISLVLWATSIGKALLLIMGIVDVVIGFKGRITSSRGQ
jgi:uncharacterized protein YybS (DUF2232 family)